MMFIQCQTLFSLKNKKNIVKLLAADFAQRLIRDKDEQIKVLLSVNAHTDLDFDCAPLVPF